MPAGLEADAHTVGHHDANLSPKHLDSYQLRWSRRCLFKLGEAESYFLFFKSIFPFLFK